MHRLSERADEGAHLSGVALPLYDRRSDNDAISDARDRFRLLGRADPKAHGDRKRGSGADALDELDVEASTRR